MDLPTCPACKQSVLDEDAVECPFCGAPMKGGAGSARPGPKPAAAKSPSARPGSANAGAATGASAPDIVAKSAASRARPGRVDEEPAATPADDDPFAVDPSVAASAIPVSRQPGPNKPLEVICPMCETKGFVSLKAAGKQVKCCNPQCMVPIFTAPAPEKKEVVAPPPPPKKKIPALYVAGGFIAIALGAYYVWLQVQPPPVQEFAPIVTGEYKSQLDPNDQAASDHKNNGQPDGADAKNQGPQDPEKVRQQIVKQALVRMLEVSPKIPSQFKHSWRRLAITTYFYAGEDKDAQDQLDLIKKQMPSEGVLPIVALAWLRAANPQEFQRAVADARLLAEKLPSRGRYASEAAVAMSALLVVSGKSDDARQLLGRHHIERDPLIEQLAAALRVVFENGTYDLDTTLIGRSLEDWQRPLATAVTLILAAHGRWDDALTWSTQAEDPVAKAEGLIAWAESYARQAVPAEDAAGWDRALKAGRDLTVAGKVRLLARLAAVKISKGDRPGAEELISQAAQALKSLPEPKPISITTVKEVYDLKAQAADAVSPRQSALAATEVAGVQAQLGHADVAWGNVRLALQYLRSMGPSLSAMEERRIQLEKNQNAVQAEISRELGLKKSDEQRSALKRYKERFRDAYAAAQSRFHGMKIVLKAAVNFGLLDHVWDELQAIERKKARDQEPLLSTALPLLLAARYDESGNQQKKDEIIGIVQPRVIPNDPEVVEQTVEQLYKAGDLPGCLEQLNAAMSPHGDLHEFALRLACRLIKQGKVADAISFSSRIKDQMIREDGLFLTAALAARTGKGEEYWKSATGMGPMESSCVCSGLVIGLNTRPPISK
ncbi:MAG TPA: hypothetical protein VGH74_08365 [Planctomycetaceae bacterium]